MNNTTKPIAAFVSKVMTMADKGIRLWLDLNEVSDDELTQLLRFKDEAGYFVFSSTKDMPKIEPEATFLPPKEFKDKTASQRLRHTLYRRWEATQSPNVITAEAYYEKQMEKIITEQLDF